MIPVSENIKSYLNSLYGKNAASGFIDFIKRKPAQYLRINTLKTDKAILRKRLEEDFSIITEEIESIPNALKIISGNELTGKTIEHITGQYYIQGLSSMIPPLILSPSEYDKTLDLCAAPGSKTTEISELMNNRGTLVANEVSLDRVKMLVYNIDRMNLLNTGTLHYKGEYLSKIFPNYFDKILVDAPCSGLGIIQKKEEVSTWWSLDRVERLVDLQTRLLVAAIKMLKVGGELVYSTCTLTPEENEFVISKILDKYPVEIQDIELPIPSHEALLEFGDMKFHPSISKARRIVPWEVDSDGFFIAKLKKYDETDSPDSFNIAEGEKRFINFNNKDLKNLLSDTAKRFGFEDEIFSHYKYIKNRNDIFFADKQWDVNNLSVFERIGTNFGVIDKSGNITLNTQAAQVLQNVITKQIFYIETHDELKKYLEGGIIKRTSSLSGQCVVKYHDYILGTGVITNEGLKSRFPRAKRTQDISYL